MNSRSGWRSSDRPLKREVMQFKNGGLAALAVYCVRWQTLLAMVRPMGLDVVPDVTS